MGNNIRIAAVLLLLCLFVLPTLHGQYTYYKDTYATIKFDGTAITGMVHASWASSGGSQSPSNGKVDSDGIRFANDGSSVSYGDGWSTGTFARGTSCITTTAGIYKCVANLGAGSKTYLRMRNGTTSTTNEILAEFKFNMQNSNFPLIDYIQDRWVGGDIYLKNTGNVNSTLYVEISHNGTSSWVVVASVSDIAESLGNNAVLKWGGVSSGALGTMSNRVQGSTPFFVRVRLATSGTGSADEAYISELNVNPPGVVGYDDCNIDETSFVRSCTYSGTTYTYNVQWDFHDPETGGACDVSAEITGFSIKPGSTGSWNNYAWDYTQNHAINKNVVRTGAATNGIYIEVQYDGEPYIAEYTLNVPTCTQALWGGDGSGMLVRELQATHEGGQLILNAPTELPFVVVVDGMGRQVLHLERVAQGNSVHPTGHLAPGMYYVRSEGQPTVKLAIH